MDTSATLRRFGYRLAYRGLALVWVLFRVRRAGVKCVITDGKRLLLVRHSYGPQAWDLPGGARRYGESAPSVAEREMAEELGLAIEAAAWRDLGRLRPRRGHHHVRILGARIHDPELRIDPVELKAAAWFDFDRLPLWTAPLLPPILTAVLKPCSDGTQNEPAPGVPGTGQGTGDGNSS